MQLQFAEDWVLPVQNAVVYEDLRLVLGCGVRKFGFELKNGLL